MLDKGNQKDYFSVESVLKGNYLIKTNWRKDMHEYYTPQGGNGMQPLGTAGTVKSRSTPGQQSVRSNRVRGVPVENNTYDNAI